MDENRNINKKSSSTDSRKISKSKSDQSPYTYTIDIDTIDPNKLENLEIPSTSQYGANIKSTRVSNTIQDQSARKVQFNDDGKEQPSIQNSKVIKEKRKMTNRRLLDERTNQNDGNSQETLEKIIRQNRTLYPRSDNNMAVLEPSRRVRFKNSSSNTDSNALKTLNAVGRDKSKKLVKDIGGGRSCKNIARRVKNFKGQKQSDHIQNGLEMKCIRKTDFCQGVPTISPEKSLSPRKEDPKVLKFEKLAGDTSIAANFKKNLCEFKSGTGDFNNVSVNANILPNEMENDNKSKSPSLYDKISKFINKTEDDGKQKSKKYSAEDLLKMLPPLMHPPTFSFFPKKGSVDEDASESTDKKLIAIVPEKDKVSKGVTIINDDSDISFNKSSQTSDQLKLRSTFISGHNFNKTPPNLYSYRASTTDKRFLGRNEHVRESQMDFKKEHSSHSVREKPTGCRCHEQKLPTALQTVDFTPFLVQLLESCLKVPQTLKYIRTANNTFVSDLGRWKSQSLNLIDKGSESAKMFKSSSSIISVKKNVTCQTCTDCHQVLERIQDILTEKKKKPCLDKLYPDGSACKKCGCGRSEEKLQVKKFIPCTCAVAKDNEISKPVLIETEKANNPDGTVSPMHNLSVVSYHAQCSVPKRHTKNKIRPNPNCLANDPSNSQEPRYVVFDLDSSGTDSDACSHCSSCSSC